MFAGTEYSNRSDGLMIPKEINHENQAYQVVGIGDNAFYNMTGTEVTPFRRTHLYRGRGVWLLHMQNY